MSQQRHSSSRISHFNEAWHKRLERFYRTSGYKNERYKVINWKIKFVALSLGFFNLFSVSEVILAQSKSTNPLLSKISQKDPLIPVGYGKRELTSFEKYRIEKAIAKLDRTAQEELKQGNQDEAFEQWYRYLKLTRVLDTELEIENLGQVGAIAWQENRGKSVRNIAERLITIQAELTLKDSLSSKVLDKFATAYQQVRYLDKAIAIYKKILNNIRKKDSLVIEQKKLEILGKLYLSRFDYPNAASIYQELLTLADNESTADRKAKFYLNTLIDIYDRTGETNKAIAIKKRLVEKYITAQNLTKIPSLEISIAQDYETLKQQDQAIASYNRTFATASTTQQLAIASDALTRLGKIYRDHDVNKAIATYNKLLKIQQQSYNYYGLINTYDLLGKIHLQLNQQTKAKHNFKAALKLAESLNYKVKYFNRRISEIN